MTQNATGDLPTLRGPGRGFTLGLGIVIDPAAAKSRLPAGSYRGGIYGTHVWIDPENRVAGLVMTQTAIIASGPISIPFGKRSIRLIEFDTQRACARL
ncbi:beta-lactamase family protein [Bradyrhizobium neotropicale]|uniref:beta-lactamase family protein n=1 Tax=Bradyrhizobium neotropicale TaxID=1497615 RepID=UPI001FF01F5B|nr:beta-lactamase family protein [Bradyrhizobium neotropicale]